jgi:hypothetical protein
VQLVLLPEGLCLVLEVFAAGVGFLELGGSPVLGVDQTLDFEVELDLAGLGFPLELEDPLLAVHQLLLQVHQLVLPLHSR